MRRLAELGSEADELEELLNAALDKAGNLGGKLSDLEAQAEGFFSQLQSLDEAAKVEALKQAEAKEEGASKFLELVQEKMAAVTQDLDDADQKTSAAQSEM